MTDMATNARETLEEARRRGLGLAADLFPDDVMAASQIAARNLALLPPPPPPEEGLWMPRSEGKP